MTKLYKEVAHTVTCLLTRTWAAEAQATECEAEAEATECEAEATEREA